MFDTDRNRAEGNFHPHKDTNGSTNFNRKKGHKIPNFNMLTNIFVLKYVDMEIELSCPAGAMLEKNS